MESEIDLSPEDEALLSRLQDWRRDRASRDAVPPYVVAHNATLAEIALHRPRSLDALTEIKGFGPTRTEKYGPEILGVLATDDPTPDAE